VNYFAELATTLQQIDPAPLLSFVTACEGTLWLAGNGGSMALAQHWACDLSKAAGRRVQALGSNPVVLTAWANDEGYETALVAELKQNAKRGDMLICLSCSGTSPNIVRAIEYAVAQRIPSILLTGDHGNGSAFCVIRVPHSSYGIIEDCFSAIGHWLTRELCVTR